MQLGSKRNPRRPRSLPWEKHLDAASRTTLDHQRAVVTDLEVLYENLQTSAIFRQLVAERMALERLTTRLMRISVESQVNEFSSRAQDHTQAWSVFSSMTASQASVPIPPSTLADHFETVMSPKSSPAAVILPEVPSVHGPLTKSDADLCSTFSCDELDQAVRQINMSSAPGPDGFTPVMVRDLFTCRAFFLFFLMFVNFCFAMAWIPLAWRCSEIFILYKGKGDPTSPDSYRGIALCCILAKTYERLLLYRLMKWWENSLVFKLTQFGFRSGSSTLDAVFVLNNLVNFVCRENRLPLHACFIDLRKAFPSVSRPALFNRLIQLGVPRPLVSAISSFYQLNTARLRVGSFLSRKFMVTLGLLEGSILSPLLFSIVFSVVWSVLTPSDLPGVGSVFRFDDLWILAFADDLVILSPCRARLSAALVSVDSELSSFNLFMNLGKTEVMTFLPRGLRVQPVFPPIVIRSVTLREVDSFRYLGVQLSRYGTLVDHVRGVHLKAQVSAHKTVNLLHQLDIRSLNRHKCYFLSFVQSQYYGLELIPYSQAFVNDLVHTRNVFMRSLFKLPLGTPSELFYVLWPSFPPAAVCLSRRLSFFRRALCHDLACVTSAFIFDSTLLLRSCGWFNDSFLFYRSICPSVRRPEDFDFARDVPALFDLFRNEGLFSFTLIRATTGPTLSFFRLVRHPEGLIKFREELSLLPNHHQHVILCFASSQLRWTLLSIPRRFCPLCGGSWHWDHFYTCTHVIPVLSSRGLSLQKMRGDISVSNWRHVFGDIAHVLIVWSLLLNADPDLCLNYDTDVFRSLFHSCSG